MSRDWFTTMADKADPNHPKIQCNPEKVGITPVPENDIINVEKEKGGDTLSKSTSRSAVEQKQTKKTVRSKKSSTRKGSCGLSGSLDDDVGFPADIKLESTNDCMPEEDKDFKVCVVCGEKASGFYFGALVCLPCKSFYIRCTKDGEPNFTCQCSGNCDIAKQGRIRCQYCRYQRCLMAGMCRKEKPETVQPAEGQVLCKVCGDIANGIHFGVNTCEGCKKFFRRGLVENQGYNCKAEKSCQINPRNRNNCRYCRYQKCLSAGMSREAIKMGRPKKSDGDSPTQSPSHSPSFAERHTPELSPQGSPSSNHSSSQMSPVNESMFQKYMMTNQPLKTETTCPPPSCQVQSEMTTSRPVLSGTPFMNLKSEPTAYNWATSSATASWPATSSIMSSHGNSVPSVTAQQTENPIMIEEEMDDILNFIHIDQASRPQNTYSDNSCLYQTTQCSMSTGSIQTSQCGMTDNLHQTPQCNMVSNPLIVNTGDNFQQNSDHYQHSPGPHSPYQQYQHSDHGSYYSNSHSPQYPSSHSPQYYPATNSPQADCHSPQSYNTPNSPQSGYQAPTAGFSGHNGYTMSPNGTTQEHFDSQKSMQGEQSSIYSCDIQNHVNQLFIKCNGTINDSSFQSQTSQYLTRDQLVNEVISLSLNKNSFGSNFCLNSSDDSHDSTDFTSNKRKIYDQCYSQPAGYTGNPYNAQSGDLVCEKYSLRSTQNYWKQQFPFDPMSRLTEDNRMVIKHIVSAYSELRDLLDESKVQMNNWNMNKDEHWPRMGKEQAHWTHVQERIIRNNKAFVEFFSKIPGFSNLDLSDRQDMCQLACFQAALILFSTEWYDPELKKFKYFWNWTLSPENPLYLFKLHLLQAGDVINKLRLSPIETTFTLAILAASADLMYMKDPDSIETVRRQMIFLLQQHLAEQGVNPNERLAAIFDILPMTRHISMWHKQLMKGMRVNIDLGTVSKLVEGISI